MEIRAWLRKLPGDKKGPYKQEILQGPKLWATLKEQTNNAGSR